MQYNKTMGRAKGAFIFGILGLSLAVFTPLAAAETRDIVITKFKGEVEIRQGQTVAWQKADEGRVIQPGDVVRTGAQSWVAIRHNSAKIQLFENTLLEFPREQSSQQVREEGDGLVTVVLQKGHSIFKVFKNRLKRRFEVISPSLIAGVKGTVFEVFEKESFQGVAVSEGVVEVINLDFRDEIIEVLANQFTEIRDNHLMPPREHLGEDLLREENHAQEKPSATELKSAIDKSDEGQPLEGETQAREDIEDFRNARETLAQDLRDERKELTTALKDERKELAATLKDERKEVAAELRDDMEVGPPEHSNAGGNPPEHSNAGGRGRGRP